MSHGSAAVFAVTSEGVYEAEGIEWSVKGGVPRVGDSVWLDDDDGRTFVYRVSAVHWSKDKDPWLSLDLDDAPGAEPTWLRELK